MRVYYEPAGSIFFGNNFQSPLWVIFFKIVLAISIGLSFLQLYLALSPSQARANTLPVSSGYVKGASTIKAASAAISPAPTQASGGTTGTGNSSQNTQLVAPPCTRPATPSPLSAPLLTMPGVTVATDSYVYYQVNGYTRSQVAQQMQQCSPVESGHIARTGYIINKSYTTVAVSPGLCKLENVKVGLKIEFIYPAWQSSPHDDAGLSQRWQHFIGALTTHENGHADLNRQFSHRILNDLNNLPPTDCNTIYAAANNIYQSNLASLRHANENYDAATNHGTTQGAVF